MEVVHALAAALRQALHMTLFGVDVVIEETSGEHDFYSSKTESRIGSECDQIFWLDAVAVAGSKNAGATLSCRSC